MSKNWLKNYNQLATSPDRQLALDLANTAWSAIDTDTVIRQQVHITETDLHIQDQIFALADYQKIYVLGFGKAACTAASTLEQILGPHLSNGLVIGLDAKACDTITALTGNHPEPTELNVQHTGQMLELIQQVTAQDLVIVIVSGGGSALLCWPIEECRQATRLYQEWLSTGGDISELNTVRKHLSHLKGGGLAAQLHPATVVSLVFSDIPGNNFQDVASGPTYLDTSTITDAQAILDKFHLQNYSLTETPKDPKIFEHTINLEFVSNTLAAQAIQSAAQSRGYTSTILSTNCYNRPDEIASEFIAAATPHSVTIIAGEPSINVPVNHGTGGRCQNVAMAILPHLNNEDTFIAIASDGQDNGPFAGAIIDFATWQQVQSQHLNYLDYTDRIASTDLFQAVNNCLLDTGPTGANVSDLFIFIRH